MSVQTVFGSLGVARPLFGLEKIQGSGQEAGKQLDGQQVAGKQVTNKQRRKQAKAEKRANLQVVSSTNTAGASMAMRITGCAVLGIGVIFGLIAFHVVLSQGQFRLAELQNSAAAKQAEYQRLRLQVAELEAPATVASVAQNRLGMVVPSSVTAVTPKAADMPRGLPVTQSATASNTEFENWMTVKPHVSLSLSE